MFVMDLPHGIRVRLVVTICDGDIPAESLGTVQRSYAPRQGYSGGWRYDVIFDEDAAGPCETYVDAWEIMPVD